MLPLSSLALMLLTHVDADVPTSRELHKQDFRASLFSALPCTHQDGPFLPWAVSAHQSGWYVDPKVKLAAGVSRAHGCLPASPRTFIITVTDVAFTENQHLSTGAVSMQCSYSLLTANSNAPVL